MAQDFHAAFGLGDDDKLISTVDADGVALAGIQALDARTTALRAENDALKRHVAELEARLARLETALAP
jgi:trimeric autotransporter adhesin